MLVPLIVRVLQLLLPALLSLLADTIDCPGIVTSGLIRPSSVGPQLEKLAIPPALDPRCVAPTERALFATDGLPTLPAPGPLFPAAKTRSISLCSHIN